jgi:signal transduction histidine kinase
MRLGPVARVAATATGIVAVVYVLGVIVLNLVVSARLAQQNDNRIADRLAAASHDPDVFSQRAPRTFRGAGDGDADSAPVFFWLLDARQAVTAHSPGAPALPTRPLDSQQPRDGLAVTVNAGRADPFRLKMTRDGTGWLVAGQSLAGVAHTKRLLLYAEVLAGPFLLLAMFFGCLVVGQRALAPVEQSRRRQLEFIADASHELRTPLTSIRGYSEMLRRGANESPSDAELARRRIEEESVRMSTLVDDMLLIARLDQGRPLERKPVDLQTIATDAAADARAVAPQRQITLTAPGSVVVEGDDLRLRQVVGNLVRNALVHTPQQTAVEIAVSTENGTGRMSVVDHGPGLQAKEMERIFEPFYRADPSRSRDSGGAGLGLSIVSAVVGAHGGTVNVTETSGGGVTFEVELPLAHA